MSIRDYMTTEVEVCSPDSTIREAAEMMRQIDVGLLPVGQEELMGVITDRDIVIRAVADGSGPDTPVRDVMTQDVYFCYEDDEVDDVADQMADLQVRRLPVINQDKELVGIVALADIVEMDEDAAGDALEGISEPTRDNG
jgi:CBS domain-containing protein